jgi:hypothetical protein
MKKNIVLFVLFVLPIVAYLFFASGVNEFSSLPVLRPHISEFGEWKSQRGESVKLSGKITILNFGGTELLHNRGNYFNLNQKVYQRYHKFTDLQFVILCPIGTEENAKALLASLESITDVAQYHFVFAPPAEISAYYDSLKLEGKLSPSLGSEFVYLIDKERNLRGRKDADEYKEGYSMFHPAELHNEMMDDFKVLLYEYRAALKKNLPKREI